MTLKDNFLFFLIFINNFKRITNTGGDIESARCRVRCLAQLKQELDSLTDDKTEEHISLDSCLKNMGCISCLQPCGQPFISIEHCEQLCQNSKENCRKSCMFLRHMRINKPGDCLNPEQMNKVQARCVEECNTDYDCEISRKCCYTGCGFACHEPLGQFLGVPNVPKIMHLRERIKTGMVEVSWTAVTTNSSTPILYIVQNKWKDGSTPENLDLSDWQQLTPTTGTNSILRNIAPDRWYQFRIGAVTENGTRGFSQPTDPFRLSKEPEPPSPPKNLSQGLFTLTDDGKLSLSINWFPPKRSDLPVARYKIYWIKRSPDETAYDLLKENKKTVDGNVLQYTIKDLEPESAYHIQVQAISAYGEIRLKSERANLYISTYSFDDKRFSTIKVTSPVMKTTLGITLPGVTNISVEESYFFEGLLWANVTWVVPTDMPEKHKISLQWSPDACIAVSDGKSISKPISTNTKASFFSIYGLQFDCRYRIELQPQSLSGELGEISEIMFSTASCSKVKLIGSDKPKCSGEHIPVINKPSNLRHKFLIANTSISAQLSWEAAPDSSSITGYRIIWGETLQDKDEVAPVLNHGEALTKVVDKEVTKYTLPNLKESTSYIVLLQALSSSESGKSVQLVFATPLLKNALHVPPYRVDKLEQLNTDEILFIEKEWPAMNENSENNQFQKKDSIHDSSSSPATHNKLSHYHRSNQYLFLVLLIIRYLLCL